VLVGEAGGDGPPGRAVGARFVEEEDRAAFGAPAVAVVLAVGVLEKVFETQRRHGGGSCRVVGEKVLGGVVGRAGQGQARRWRCGAWEKGRCRDRGSVVSGPSGPCCCRMAVLLGDI
jgi:hypothetical protein